MMEPVILQLLGVLRSLHVDPDRTPIQPCLAEDTEGEACLAPALAGGLQGLEAFSHAWLIYHRARPEGLVLKPFMSEASEGVFACRFPHRPNALGTTLGRILRVEGANAVFTGTDSLDGTPLLDLKPYFPQADRPETPRRIGTRPA